MGAKYLYFSILLLQGELGARVIIVEKIKKKEKREGEGG